MTSWKTNLLLANGEIGKVDFHRGVFQGDSLSPLLFTIALCPLTSLSRKVLSHQREETVNHIVAERELLAPSNRSVERGEQGVPTHR